MAGYTWRKQVIDPFSFTVEYRNGTSPWTIYSLAQAGLQVTSSRSNPGWVSYKRTRKPGSSARLGGDFISIKHERDLAPRSYVGHSGTQGTASYHEMRGCIIPFTPSDLGGQFVVPYNKYDISGSGQLALPSDATLDAAGATAISRCAPTNPHAQLAESIGEVLSGEIPNLRFKTIHDLVGAHPRLKSLPDDYLKIMMDTLPTISDIQEVKRAMDRRHAILAQYARDSGRPVRRRYNFPVDITHTVSAFNKAAFPSVIVGFTTVNSLCTKTSHVSVDTWFSGAFVYHRSGGDKVWSSLFQKYQDLNHLLGSGIGPGTAWQLTPWSWAVDYFTNVGDVMNNVQMMMNDGLIMRYGFVMRTRRESTEWHRPSFSVDNSWRLVPMSKPWIASSTDTYKYRKAANPFGFGVSYSGLSNRQWSILAALGITRGSHIA